MLKHHSVNLSTTSDTTNMPRCKKAMKYPIVGMKKKLKKEKLDKSNPLRAHEDEDNSLLYHFHKYKKKQSSNKKGYLAYQKWSRLNTKTRKISNKLKDTYGITVGTDLPKCAEPPDPIVKCANFNIRPIQNRTLVYQMQLCIVRSALIIGRRPFVFIKGSKYSDPIDYLLCNRCEVHLSDKYTDKENGPQFIWPGFYRILLCYKDIHNHYSSEFIWNFSFGIVWMVVRWYCNSISGILQQYFDYRPTINING